MMITTSEPASTWHRYPLDRIHDAPSSATPNNVARLTDLIRYHHSLYQMEYRDRPNVLTRVLVCLYDLGASQAQLEKVYYTVQGNLQSLRSVHATIHQDNWQEHLGHSSAYGDYLMFFDGELVRLGLDTLVDTYFYQSSLSDSAGSQLQPLVHLAFGLEKRLPDIVTQSLAYLASTHLPVSELIEPLSEPLIGDRTTSSTSSAQSLETLLLDLVSADPRFDGKMEGDNTFHSAVKLLLKSKHDLLQTYMAEWVKLPFESSQQRLGSLTLLAIRFMSLGSQQSQEHDQVELDPFLGGGQLLQSALAIRTLTNHRPQYLDRFVNLQFVATLCTYVVQGRPKPSKSVPSGLTLSSNTWADCVAHIVESGDPKAILAIHSLIQARELNEQQCLDTAAILVRFSQNGSWIKGGIGQSSR
ncbi:uncharacterized protein BYT42DRAFT_577102 [Radiomyces spectabilis]|uniref:uncharacterized protein n=1 Tax=Radiomyces spectabilis TaxID=64574 RepID=UPI002220FD23|nr:uncharacterized protein BYT42DRAFT_577102 [Radiomyces spectabilis]KAI8374640.1 hypothetical protein BYT42DRAFT_577102 [Radiomyces spectabilis]